jgi:hypothetical protein
MKRRKEVEQKAQGARVELHNLMTRRDDLINEREAKMKSLNDNNLDPKTIKLIPEALKNIKADIDKTNTAIKRKESHVRGLRQELQILNKAN